VGQWKDGVAVAPGAGETSNIVGIVRATGSREVSLVKIPEGVRSKMKTAPKKKKKNGPVIECGWDGGGESLSHFHVLSNCSLVNKKTCRSTPENIKRSALNQQNQTESLRKKSL